MLITYQGTFAGRSISVRSDNLPSRIFNRGIIVVLLEYILRKSVKRIRWRYGLNCNVVSSKRYYEFNVGENRTGEMNI